MASMSEEFKVRGEEATELWGRTVPPNWLTFDSLWQVRRQRFLRWYPNVAGIPWVDRRKVLHPDSIIGDGVRFPTHTTTRLLSWRASRMRTLAPKEMDCGQGGGLSLRNGTVCAVYEMWGGRPTYFLHIVTGHVMDTRHGTTLAGRISEPALNGSVRYSFNDHGMRSKALRQHTPLKLVPLPDQHTRPGWSLYKAMRSQIRHFEVAHLDVETMDPPVHGYGVRVSLGLLAAPWFRGPSSLSSLMPEWNTDGRHCYAVSKEAWFARLQALDWGAKAEERARDLLRKLVLPPGCRLQYIPPLSAEAVGSACIAVSEMTGKQSQVYWFTVFPDQAFGRHVRLMGGTLAHSTWDRSRVISSPVPPLLGDWNTIESSQLGSLTLGGYECKDKSMMHGLGVHVELTDPKADNAGMVTSIFKTQRKNKTPTVWLVEPEQAAAYVSLQLATAGLPIA